MIGLNPLHEWWKMSSYTKWYHNFWLTPIIAVFLGIAWVVLTIVDSVLFKK
ncbi:MULTISPECIES: hypothetical protein [unclassified Bacillus cereus group]|uniref:hypothetical protein n=1 Tax=unclassified Bacillus cereus group TaxID=2750818 RepID=UPI003399BEC8